MFDANFSMPFMLCINYHRFHYPWRTVIVDGENEFSISIKTANISVMNLRIALSIYLLNFDIFQVFGMTVDWNWMNMWFSKCDSWFSWRWRIEYSEYSFVAFCTFIILKLERQSNFMKYYEYRRKDWWHNTSDWSQIARIISTKLTRNSRIRKHLLSLQFNE